MHRHCLRVCVCASATVHTRARTHTRMHTHSRACLTGGGVGGGAWEGGWGGGCGGWGRGGGGGRWVFGEHQIGLHKRGWAVWPGAARLAGGLAVWRRGKGAWAPKTEVVGLPAARGRARDESARRTVQQVVAFGLVAALLLATNDVPLGQRNGCPARPYLSVAPHVAGTQQASSEAGLAASLALLYTSPSPQ